MNSEEIVLELIAEAVPRKFRSTGITRDKRLQADLGLDSLGVLSVLFRVEQALGIDLSNLDFVYTPNRLRTVGDALDLSEEMLIRARGART